MRIVGWNDGKGTPVDFGQRWRHLVVAPVVFERVDGIRTALRRVAEIEEDVPILMLAGSLAPVRPLGPGLFGAAPVGCCVLAHWNPAIGIDPRFLLWTANAGRRREVAARAAESPLNPESFLAEILRQFGDTRRIVAPVMLHDGSLAPSVEVGPFSEWFDRKSWTGVRRFPRYVPTGEIRSRLLGRTRATAPSGRRPNR